MEVGVAFLYRDSMVVALFQKEILVLRTEPVLTIIGLEAVYKNVAYTY